jgi:hypothetical protein
MPKPRSARPVTACSDWDGDQGNSRSGRFARHERALDRRFHCHACRPPSDLQNGWPDLPHASKAQISQKIAAYESRITRYQPKPDKCEGLKELLERAKA